MSAATKVLVAYASRMGGTAGIAEAIGQTFRRCGHEVDVVDAANVTDMTPYGAVVVGSAIYFGRWRPEAVAVLRLLAAGDTPPPVWLFHSGPIGPDKDVEQPVPRTVARLAKQLGSTAPTTFAGRLERHTARGVLAHWMARSRMSGDSRDWAAIKQWTRNIHDTLQAARAPLRHPGHPLELSPDLYDAVLFGLEVWRVPSLGTLALIAGLKAAGLTVEVIPPRSDANATALDPAVVLATARRLVVQPSRTVVIEDRPAGIMAGRAGGFGLVIGVDRTGHAADLTAHGADVVVTDLAEVTVLAPAGSGPGR